MMDLLRCTGEALPTDLLDQLDTQQAAAFDGLTARENPAAWRWLAVDAGQALSGLAARPHPCPAALPGAGPGINLAYLWTAPAARGRGLGLELIRRALADLPGLGQGWAILNCVPGLVPFYARAGFTTVASSCAYEQYPDPDPVMAWAVRPALLERLRVDPFPYGIDW